MNRVKMALASGIVFSASLALCAPAAAQKQDVGLYIGGAFGMSSFDMDTTGITNPRVDDSDSGFKLYGGYQFNRNLAVEVGYVDFGSVGIGGSIGGIPFNGNIDVTAMTVAAVGTLPLNESFSLLGKAGIWNWDAKASVAALGTTGNGSSSGTDPFFGVGLRYNINRNLGVQLEVEQYSGDDSITYTSLGLRYKF
jgi:OOP family OmpA-OmpF porin